MSPVHHLEMSSSILMKMINLWLAAAKRSIKNVCFENCFVVEFVKTIILDFFRLLIQIGPNVVA